jgi:hypothetical protein
VSAPDPLPLRTIAIPRKVTHVEGCDCGGSLELHTTECSIRRLPEAQARAAVEAAQDRLRQYTAELNARLRAALGAL